MNIIACPKEICALRRECQTLSVKFIVKQRAEDMFKRVIMKLEFQAELDKLVYRVHLVMKYKGKLAKIVFNYRMKIVVDNLSVKHKFAEELITATTAHESLSK